MNDPFSKLPNKPPVVAPPVAPPFICVMPVPDDAPAPPDAHPILGKPTGRWTYLDAEGGLLGFALRFDTADSKQFRPLTLWRPAKGGAPTWRWEAWPSPRPLYGLDKLASSPTAPVLIAEGEKAVDAAGKLLPDYAAVTSPNGSKSAAKADWTPLRGRHVTIWPDADEPGASYASAVADHARAAGAASVAILTPQADAVEGWDAADALAEGWTAAQTLALVTSARAVVSLDAARASKAKRGGADSAEGRSGRRPPQRDQLMTLAGEADLWRDQAGDAYATIPINNHRENWPIASIQFKRWLSVRSYRETGLTPGAQAVEDCLRVLAARAYAEGPTRVPCLRVGSLNGTHYVDLCDDQWQALEIDTDGWRIVSNPPVAFVRSSQMRALPEPDGGYYIAELRRFVNVSEEDDFVLLVMCIMAVLRSSGPYPILTFSGEQGTGKSTISRLVRSLIDPNAAPIRTAPKDDRDLFVGAVNAHVLAYDNLSAVPHWLSDGLCRLSTGGGFASRQLHTDRDESVLQALRPIILNGIGEISGRPDLADRAVSVRLKTIPEDERRPESELWDDWNLVAPRVLGALLDGFSAGLRVLPAVKLDRLPRMADFARWGAACEGGLGFEPGAFLNAYFANRAEVSETTFEGDPVATAIRDFIRADYPDSGWHGTATELLDALALRVPESTRRNTKIWPQSAQAMGVRVDRVAPLLRQQGFTVERRHSGSRIISIVPK